MVVVYFICNKIGLTCPHANFNGECQIKSCIKQTDDIDELDLFDMLDEEKE